MRWMTMAVILLALTGRTALAQVKEEPYRWKNVKITAGGFITGIVCSPAEAGLAYCRTDIGGAYRWDIKQKQWVCMTDWVGPQERNLGGCESVAPDPRDAEKVYLALGTYSGGISGMARSRDRGKTWAVTRVPIAMGGNEDGRGMGERLAVDPNDGRVLFFGSRSAGLWRSGDGAVTWERVETWPADVGRAAGARGAPGLPWVLFDQRKEDTAGEPTKSVFVGAASGGESSLYHTTDGGKTWAAVAGSPRMMPHRAVLDAETHLLYVSYGNGPGPNNVTAGAVAKYDIDAKSWTDITPRNPGNGGYGGLALDRQHPKTLMVATIDHWAGGDAIFRSTDGGTTWKAINTLADRQTTGVPYLSELLRGHAFDWWLAALAIDPFDSNHVLYGTGAMIWGTHDMTEFDAGRRTRWNPEAEGIEETAVLALASPPWGDAHLISGVGDIGGFTHVDLSVSPPVHTNPMFSNTNAIALAWKAPVVVRTGTASRNAGTAAYSEDGGISWQAMTLPASAAGRGATANRLAVSADGKTLVAGNSVSRDKGIKWTTATGLGNGARVVADRVLPSTFYALDLTTPQIFTSTDGAATFAAKPVKGLSQSSGSGRGFDGNATAIEASFAKAGELWVLTGGTLYHSTDGGENFGVAAKGISIRQFALGKGAPGRSNDAVFASGSIGNTPGIFRSDDDGETWVKLDDTEHQFGGNLTVMAGDPRVYGRVYLGMNGRGVIRGDLP
jgi:xyloglucan-specific exo-beta-1,4-glucanase